MILLQKLYCASCYIKKELKKLESHKQISDINQILSEKAQIRKKILKIAIPSASEQVLIMVVGVVSTILVGRLSSEALSAVGLVNTLLNFILVLFTALSTGATVLVARLIGEGNLTGANSASKQSLVIGTAASFVIAFASYILAYRLLLLFFSSADPIVLSMALIYFKITLFSFPLLLINVIVGGILRGAGDTRTPMYVAYIVNILNVILGFILIFGVDFWFINIKGTGITGAAWAVTIARGIGGLLMLAALLKPGRILNIRLNEKFTFDYIIIRRILKVGVPAALEQVIVQGGILLLQVVIAGMGTTAIAVYQVGMSIYSISYMPVWGFAIAATTLVGQALGAKQSKMAEIYGWNILKIGMYIIFLLGTITFIFSKPLVRLYSTETEIIIIGSQVIKIFSISMPFLCIVQVIASALRGAGDLIYTTITSFIGIWGFRLLLSILLDRFFGLGIHGVWIALCFDFAIRAVMYFIRFKKGRWKNIVI